MKRSSVFHLLMSPLAWDVFRTTKPSDGLLRMVGKPHLHRAENGSFVARVDFLQAAIDWLTIELWGNREMVLITSTVGDPATEGRRLALKLGCIEEKNGTIVAKKGAPLMVILVLNQKDRDGWHGMVVDRGVIYPLGGYEIIGTPRSGAVGSMRFRKGRKESYLNVFKRSNINLTGINSAIGEGIARGCAHRDVKRIRLIEDGWSGLSSMRKGKYRQLAYKNAFSAALKLVRDFPNLGLTFLKSNPKQLTRDTAQIGPTNLYVSCLDSYFDRVVIDQLALTHHLAPHLDVFSERLIIDGGQRDVVDVRLLFPGGNCSDCLPVMLHDGQEMNKRILQRQSRFSGTASTKLRSSHKVCPEIETKATQVAMGLIERIIEGELDSECWMRLENDGEGGPITCTQITRRDRLRECDCWSGLSP